MGNKTTILILSLYNLLLYYSLPLNASGIVEVTANCEFTYARFTSLNRNYPAVHTGEQVLDIPQNILKFVPNRANTRLLGSGLAGGDVYLIETGTSKFVLKKYHSQIALSNDIERFKFLKTFIANHKDIQNCFNIPDYLPLENKVIKMEYIRGTSLDKLQKNREIPISLKNEISKKFDFCLKIFLNILKNEASEFHEQLFLYHFDFSTSTYRLELFLRDDNILVTPSGQFYIIDPY